MSSIGRLMIQSGVLTDTQLNEAIRAKAVFGGRIETNLVELGFVTDTTLQAFLALHHGVNPLSADALPTQEALDCLSRADCDELNVLPLSLEGETLVLAMVDPSETEVLMRAQRKAKRPVRAVVAPEGRLYALMREVLGIERGLRYAVVAAEAERAIGAGRTANAETSDADGELDGDKTADIHLRGILRGEAFAGPRAKEPDDGLIFEEVLLSDVVDSGADFEINTMELRDVVESGVDDFAIDSDPGFDIRTADIDFSPATAPAADAAVMEAHRALGDDARPLSFQEALVSIDECIGRDPLARTVLRYALWHYRRALLFTVQRGLMLGWDGLGAQLDRDLAKQFLIPLTAASAFRDVCRSGQAYQGALGDTPLMKVFVRKLGDDWPDSCQLVPFVVGNRVVAVLYADGPLSEQTPARTSEFQILSTQVSRAFARFIAQLDALFV